MNDALRKSLEFLRNEGVENVAHSQRNYLAHVVGVYRWMSDFGFDEELCQAGLFHSIYGTELFQGFSIDVSRRDEIRTLIGARAEKLAYCNCVMDRSTLDAALSQTAPPFRIRDRAGQILELTAEEYDDLCRVHLFDWFEQVPRSRHGWSYRRDAYRAMAQRLGDDTVRKYEEVFAQEPTVLA